MGSAEVRRRKWLAEPLLHFFLIGALLFAAYAVRDRGGDNTPRAVRLTGAEVNWLTQNWARQWQRPPSDEELRSLVAGYVEELLLARRAEELGLDDNDTVIRRRLAQKMDFLVTDTAAVTEPDEAALRQFHAARRAHYAAPERVSFSQRYFTDAAAAHRALAVLAKRADADVGEPSSLPGEYLDLDGPAVASVFGEEFADRLSGLAPDQWQGPIASAYGFHLVRIDARQPARDRPFDEVRAAVLVDWQSQQRARAKQRLLAELRAEYGIDADAEVKALLPPIAGTAP